MTDFIFPLKLTANSHSCSTPNVNYFVTFSLVDLQNDSCLQFSKANYLFRIKKENYSKNFLGKWTVIVLFDRLLFKHIPNRFPLLIQM